MSICRADQRPAHTAVVDRRMLGETLQVRTQNRRLGLIADDAVQVVAKSAQRAVVERLGDDAVDDGGAVQQTHHRYSRVEGLDVFYP
ncbi:hypothetical protein [Subtercola sp. YIM 133946]|uniref:hypothetical protein n=1 Tax=Subtercola sp. YIM 133946 TaxID=3118909 RepID=UPI002F925401